MEGEFSIKEALRTGWDETKSHLGLYIALGALTLAANFVLALLAGHAHSSFSSFTIAVAAMLVRAFFALGWLRIVLRRLDGKEASLGNLRTDGPTYLGFLATYVLFGLMVMVGLVLFVVPGIYLALRFGQAPFLVADHKLEPIEAFKQSSRMTEGVKWDLLLLTAVTILIELLGAVALGVGLLLTMPIAVIAWTHVYRRLHHRIEVRPPIESHPQPLGV